jgi:hypothetical protein
LCYYSTPEAQIAAIAQHEKEVQQQALTNSLNNSSNNNSNHDSDSGDEVAENLPKGENLHF